MTGEKALKQAIEYLTMDNFPMKEIIVEVAKSNPAAFCKAVEKIIKPKPKWQVLAEQALSNEKKINAIKETRVGTGMDLKEAKEAVEFFEDNRTWNV